MSKVTIGFGALLCMVALAGFIATGSSHPTALIPGAIGIVFCVLGFLAYSAQAKRRMLLMHIAVTLAVLCFLGTIKSDIDIFRLAHGATFEHPLAVEEKAAMSLLSLLFVLLCIRSFIMARRDRLAV